MKLVYLAAINFFNESCFIATDLSPNPTINKMHPIKSSMFHKSLRYNFKPRPTLKNSEIKNFLSRILLDTNFEDKFEYFL